MDMKKFKNPPMESRPAPFWSWNDDMTKEELTRQVREMGDKGWGSFFMHSRVGLVTPYLKDKWFELVNACCEAAKDENMYAHLYDEDKWPSGYAGGEVVKNEAYRQRSLCLMEKDKVEADDVVYKDLGDRVILNRTARAGSTWFNGYCYADLMNKEVTEEFFRTTHDKYAEKCAEYMGNVIPTVFTDEPCYQMSSPGRQGAPDCDFLPWTDALPEVFKEKKGYDLLEKISALFYDEDGYEKVRFDYFDVALGMFIDGFTKPYGEWCEKHDVDLTGHMMAEDTLDSQIAWTGASMPHYEYMQRPGIDKLSRNIEIVQTVKQLTSVSEQLDKKRNLSEVFGCMGQQSSFFERKWISQWQAVLGINFVNHHLSLYSMRGERKRDWPQNFFYQQPWWSEEKEFSDYIARTCEYVHSTKRDVDILFIHPVTTGWCLYDVHCRISGLPSKLDLYNNGFISLTKALLADKLDFHYGDETIMKKHASVKDGAICIGNFRYHTVVVPPVMNLMSNTVALLDEFVRQGGKIVCQSPCVSLIDGSKSEAAFMKGAKVVELCGECVSYVSSLYPDRIQINDKLSKRNATTVYADHKFDDEFEYYFIVSNEEKRSLNTQIRIKTDKYATLLDLSDGEEYEIDAKSEGGYITFDAKFYPAGAVIVRLSDKKRDAAPMPKYLGSAVEFEKAKVIGEGKVIKTSLCEDNLLVLNDATLELDGKIVAEDMPVNLMHHTLFYPAKNGTPFKATYRFIAEGMPEGELTAAIEMAHNLDKITFNGKAIAIPEENVMLDDSCYKDIYFRKVSLGKPQIGKNVLVIEGIKDNNITDPNCHVAVDNYETHKPTELEAIYITGNFSVKTTDNISFAIVEPYEPCYKDIVESGCNFYAGNVDIVGEFVADQNNMPTYLRLDGVEASCVRLCVNGADCGVCYWEPFVYDISDVVAPGENKFEIRLYTTLFNMTGPNRVNGIKDIRCVDPRCMVDPSRFNEKYEFVNYGVKGIKILK